MMLNQFVMEKVLKFIKVSALKLLKHVSITSVDVEKNFSVYINILSDNNQIVHPPMLIKSLYKTSVFIEILQELSNKVIVFSVKWNPQTSPK